jgi:hypothetical protein
VCYENLTRAASQTGIHNEVRHLVEDAGDLNIKSIELSKHALQAAMAIKDIDSARKHIQELMEMVPADQEGLRQKLQAVAQRLGGRFAATGPELVLGA